MFLRYHWDRLLASPVADSLSYLLYLPSSSTLCAPISECTSLMVLLSASSSRLIQYWLVFSVDCLFPYVCLYNPTVLCQRVSKCPCLSLYSCLCTFLYPFCLQSGLWLVGHSVTMFRTPRILW